jgi:hypothetical protein
MNALRFSGAYTGSVTVTRVHALQGQHALGKNRLNLVVLLCGTRSNKLTFVLVETYSRLVADQLLVINGR